MGVAGAAYATVIGRAISGIYIVYKVLTNDKDLKLNLRAFKFNFKIGNFFKKHLKK